MLQITATEYADEVPLYRVKFLKNLIVFQPLVISELNYAKFFTQISVMREKNVNVAIMLFLRLILRRFETPYSV